RAAPELKAVALLPIDADLRMRFLLVGDLLARRLVDPLLRDQLLTVPLTSLQVELAELGDILRAELEAETSERVALGAGSPLGLLNPQRLEQSRHKVFERRLAGRFRDDRRERVAPHRVVLKMRAGFVRNGVGEKRLDRRHAGDCPRLALVPAR